MKSKRAQVLGSWLGFVMALVLAAISSMHGNQQPVARAEGDAPQFPAATPTPTRTPTPINIGNFVWSDLDADGRQDASEPGLPGVTVQLWNSTKTDLIDQTTTNANGNYTLIAPTPGNYRVRFILTNFLDQFTVKDNATAGDQLDSDVNVTGANVGFTDIYVLGSNVISISSIDAGIIKFYTPTPTRTPTPINIGNFIWADDNGNGIQDVGETGLANVTVQLWNSTKTALIAQTTTNASGIYTLVAPVPGDYRVRVLLGIGSSFTLKDIGSDEQKDSDCGFTGGNIGFTDVFNIASNVISTSIYDCGLLGPYATATTTNTPPPTSTSTVTPTPTQTQTPMVETTETVVVPPDEFPVYLPIVTR